MKKSIKKLFILSFLALLFFGKNINSIASYLWIIAGSIVSLIIALIFSRLMPKKTLKGAEDCWKWKGFKLYLETAEKYRMEACKPEYFEKYLPFAIVMGVEKKWGKVFEMLAIPIQQPEWYVSEAAVLSAGLAGNNSGGGFSPTGFANSISSMTSSFAHFTSNSGSGASFGGGFSGGGAGGGGGGAG